MSEEMPTETRSAERTVPSYVHGAKQALATFLPEFERMAATITSLVEGDKEQTARIADLTRLLKEAEQRAVEAEKRADQLAEKAARNDRLEDAVRSFITAFDRLPVTMQGVSVIPGATRPAIELYGTYEWKAVTDAKFWMADAMKDKQVM